ncbi:PEP-CTERM sorting domain-containing protein [Piscinibacter sp.]|uniref:PEP-CTERM sorting domain-containing protein n=1 Tax=Piscinibacter sp. TaxID=1903157 RepID=UPI002B86B0AF|nr:PEP-CTERM sorting domain-containing protein [Albitalea sp.]HUG23080.1 PEP-CTERM sorting domain-containing protein [Albitalea sp.]
MKRKLHALAAAALLTASSYSLAATVNIGGLNVPVGPVFTVASLYENVITEVGQELSGVGEVTQINGMAISELCAGCELTYHFGGYTVTDFTATTIEFSGGWANFYLGFDADNDFNPFASGSSAEDLAAATNGTLWLTLSGHQIDAAGNTFAGTGTDIGTPSAVGFGAGLADVDHTGMMFGNTAGAGALANNAFDTNAIPADFAGNADFQLGSSFSNVLLPHPNECPGGPECLAGSVDIRGVIPEPETYALMLAGLGVVGFVARRRSRKL